MDGQLKRGLLDVCVLAAIKTKDSYGYKIIKDMKPYLELSESTLYTILKRLESITTSPKRACSAMRISSSSGKKSYPCTNSS